MNMKKSSWLFMLTLAISTMITLSSNNWISMWIGLELNMMSFIPLIVDKINKSSSEAAMIYFLVQSISSMLLIMMVMLLLYKYLVINNNIFMMINISLLIKLGAAPFHMWLPEIMSKMEWSKCIILMTWQKIAPLFMMSNLNTSSIINLSIIWSVGIGSLGGINQSSLRKMMGYSSINHLGWMLAINKSMNLWIIYLMIYSMMVSLMCMMFMNYKMYFINQVSSMNMSDTEKISLFIMMLSMGGLPPFIGFLPKWMTIQSMMNNYEIIMILFMIMCSLITLMYYLRVMMNMYLSYNSSIKWSNIYYKIKPLTFFTMMINLSLPLILVLEMF
uniref:NADH-ubiquinone oxidoreductase chain 2 n=1 Tax=Eurydema gebleri TaxID=286707 RepID=A0A0H3VQ16_EURGE|nr:NADH dehydrogenase subunit 2 [Eurydema gebleri]AKE36777.1 NADH dehydrogenase subunit 2 [Eurydema gebleri]